MCCLPCCPLRCGSQERHFVASQHRQRRRVSAGVTAAQALDVQRRKHHELEGRKLGIRGFETAGETVKKPALHIAITKYLEQIAALKKPNTHRKYEAVLNRFGEFFRDCVSIDA